MNTDELLKLLVCPACRHPLQSLPGGLCCENCNVVYPIHDQIPVLLIEAAIPLDEWSKGEKK